MPPTRPKSNLSLRDSRTYRDAVGVPGRVIVNALCIFCLATIAAKSQTATTQGATGVTDIAATLHGVVNPASQSGFSYCTFQFGTDTSYAQTVNATIYSVSGIAPIAVTANPPGLLPNTTYHWRFKLTNAQGSTYSTDQSFTTMRTPALTTGMATHIASLAATFNGTVNPMGQVFEVSFEFGTDTSYGSRTRATPETVYHSGITAVSARCGHLQPGTTYHYRAIAFASGMGAVPGPDQVFTTQSDIATECTANVTDLGATVAATVNVGSSFSRFTFWFEYGTSTDYGARSSGPASTQNDPLHPGFQVVTAGLYNLLPATLYHCRIKVQESWDRPVFSGRDFTFTTAAPATPPTVLPSGPRERTPVAPTGATLSASIISGSSAATVTVEYGIDTSYGMQVIVPTPVPGSIDSDYVLARVTWLTPNTTYHYRFKATNNEGTNGKSVGRWL